MLERAEPDILARRILASAEIALGLRGVLLTAGGVLGDGSYDEHTLKTLEIAEGLHTPLHEIFGYYWLVLQRTQCLTFGVEIVTMSDPSMEVSTDKLVAVVAKLSSLSWTNMMASFGFSHTVSPLSLT